MQEYRIKSNDCALEFFKEEDIINLLKNKTEIEKKYLEEIKKEKVKKLIIKEALKDYSEKELRSIFLSEVRKSNIIISEIKRDIYSLQQKAFSCEKKDDYYYRLWVKLCEYKISKINEEKLIYQNKIKTLNIISKRDTNQENSIRHIDIDEIKEISIINFLTSQGYKIEYQTQNETKFLCPFHNEKTGSFTVSKEKNIAHCFGCGFGGSIIDVYMKIYSCNVKQAIKELSKQIN